MKASRRHVLQMLLCTFLFCAAAVTARDIHFESGEPQYQLAPWGSPEYRARISDLDPSESVEILYDFSWPSRSGATEEERLNSLEDALLRVEGMSGLTYPDSEEVLYHRVAIVDSPDSREPVEGPQALDRDEQLDFFVLQDDEDFGKIVMRISVVRGERIRVEVCNETRIKLGIIPAVKPENMLLVFEVHPHEDGVMVYGVGGLRTGAPGFLRGIVRNHLEVRVDAMVRWLRRELNRG